MNEKKITAVVIAGGQDAPGIYLTNNPNRIEELQSGYFDLFLYNIHTSKGYCEAYTLERDMRDAENRIMEFIKEQTGFNISSPQPFMNGYNTIQQNPLNYSQITDYLKKVGKEMDITTKFEGGI